MKKAYFFFKLCVSAIALGFIITSCGSKNNQEMLDELLKVDQEFSEMSGDKGVKKAFLSYIDTAGILLRENQMPIDGKQAVIEHFRNYSDSGYVLSWTPLGADIASSGNLGYTYGVYKVESIDKVSKGTYVTIWKKNKKGAWKLVLDSGNNGIGEIN